MGVNNAVLSKNITRLLLLLSNLKRHVFAHRISPPSTFKIIHLMWVTFWQVRNLDSYLIAAIYWNHSHRISYHKSYVWVQLHVVLYRFTLKLGMGRGLVGDGVEDLVDLEDKIWLLERPFTIWRNMECMERYVRAIWLKFIYVFGQYIHTHKCLWVCVCIKPFYTHTMPSGTRHFYVIFNNAFWTNYSYFWGKHPLLGSCSFHSLFYPSMEVHFCQCNECFTERHYINFLKTSFQIIPAVEGEADSQQ